MTKNADTANLEKFKDLIIAPLKKGLEQNLTLPLGNFNMREELLRVWDHSDVIKMVIKHVENTYANLQALENEYKNKSDEQTAKDISSVPADHKNT